MIEGEVEFQGVTFGYEGAYPGLAGHRSPCPSRHDNGTGRTQRRRKEHVDRSGNGVSPPTGGSRSSSTGGI